MFLSVIFESTNSHYFLTLYFSILSDIVGYILKSDLNKQDMFQTTDHLVEFSVFIISLLVAWLQSEI